MQISTVLPVIFAVNESSNSRTSCQSKKHKKKRLVDGKKHAALLVQKIREKSKTEKQTNKVDVNVQRLLNLSQANIIHRKLENKVNETFFTSHGDYVSNSFRFSEVYFVIVTRYSDEEE